MKIALVDDERIYLSEIEALCEEYAKSRDCHIEVTSFTGGRGFLSAIESAPPCRFSMVFLDIYMDDVDGITVARALRKADPDCLLVFLTSTRDFMPEAFSFHAFEYIQKPMTRERLERVLDDAARLLPIVSKYIELGSEREVMQVYLKDIAYAVTDRHYLDITMEDGSVLRQRMTAAEFLARTGGDDRFFLANRGVILNIGHIRSFADGCCIMSNGAALPMRVKEARLIEQAVMKRSFKAIRSHQNMGRDEK